MQATGERQPGRDGQIPDAARPQSGAHAGISGAAHSILARAGLRCLPQLRHHLAERHEPGADHHAVRHVERLQRHAGHRHAVAAREQAHAEHRERPRVADEGGAEGRHRQREPRTERTGREAAHEHERLASARITRANRLCRREPRRPRAFGREDAAAEEAIEDPGVEEHRAGHAGEERQHQILAAEQIRHTDRQQQRVRRAKRGGRHRALRQVLRMHRPEHAQAGHRQTSEQHREQRADERGVRRDAERRQQLHADDGASGADGHERHEQRRREGARMGHGSRPKCSGAAPYGPSAAGTARW